MVRKRFQTDDTPFVRNAHVSTLSDVLLELRRRFRTAESRYFPWRLPSASLNLCVALRLTRLPPAGPSAEVRGGKSAWLGG